MISKETAPANWAMLMYELEDAHEHLGTLIEDMASDPDFSEEEFRIYLGHVYAHLNRAWHRRNDVDCDGEKKKDWDETSQFPTDLKPF